MKWTTEQGNQRGWVYTFMSGSRAVVLNRLGEVIHEANTYAEAEKWANSNYDAIDGLTPINEPTPTEP